MCFYECYKCSWCIGAYGHVSVKLSAEGIEVDSELLFVLLIEFGQQFFVSLFPYDVFFHGLLFLILKNRRDQERVTAPPVLHQSLAHYKL